MLLERFCFKQNRKTLKHIPGERTDQEAPAAGQGGEATVLVSAVTVFTPVGKERG